MTARRLAALFGLLIGCSLLLLQFSLTIGRRMVEQGDSLPGTLVFFFTFYTVLTNLMLVLIYLSELTPARWLSWWRSPVTRGMMAGAMSLVGIFNHFFLHGLQTFEGWFLVGEIGLHYVTPILFVLWWLLFQPKGSLRPADIPLMLLPTLLWLVWTMARGAMVAEYPYPILDAVRLGYPQVALNCILVFAGLVLFLLVVLGLDRLLGRQPAAR